jgi:hypothetical protein
MRNLYYGLFWVALSLINVGLGFATERHWNWFLAPVWMIVAGIYFYLY